MYSNNSYTIDSSMEQLSDGFNLLNASEISSDFEYAGNDDAALFLQQNDPLYNTQEPTAKIPAAPTAQSIAKATEAMPTKRNKPTDSVPVTTQFYRVKRTQIIVVLVELIGNSAICEHANGHREVYNVSTLLKAKKREQFTPLKPGAKATKKRTAKKAATTKKRTTAKRTSSKQATKKQPAKKQPAKKRVAKKPAAKKAATTKKRTVTKKRKTTKRAKPA